MRKYIFGTLAILSVAAFFGLLIAWTIAVSNEPPAPTADLDDVPVKGEQWVAVQAGDNGALLVDPASIKNEPDGSKSIKFMMIALTKGAPPHMKAGRVAFKCHSRQYRTQSVFELDPKDGHVTSPPRSGDYEEIPENSNAAFIGGHVCSTTLPADSGI